MPGSADYVDCALDALGGEATAFYLRVQAGRVALECRYQGCGWGYSLGEAELWETVADARSHWEERHAGGA